MIAGFDKDILIRPTPCVISGSFERTHYSTVRTRRHGKHMVKDQSLTNKRENTMYTIAPRTSKRAVDWRLLQGA